MWKILSFHILWKSYYYFIILLTFCYIYFICRWEYPSHNHTLSRQIYPGVFNVPLRPLIHRRYICYRVFLHTQYSPTSSFLSSIYNSISLLFYQINHNILFVLYIKGNIPFHSILLLSDVFFLYIFVYKVYWLLNCLSV